MLGRRWLRAQPRKQGSIAAELNQKNRGHLDQNRNSSTPMYPHKAWNWYKIRLLTISLVGWDSEPPPLAWDHVKEAFVPAIDDLTLSEIELKRIVAIARGVELSTGGEECSGLGIGSTDSRRWRYRCDGRTYVMHFNGVAWRCPRLRLGDGWNVGSLDQEFSWGLCGRH